MLEAHCKASPSSKHRGTAAFSEMFFRFASAIANLSKHVFANEHLISEWMVSKAKEAED
ncbi:hypothetical protein PN836_012090 [Ningiella sp. W23]|uniref:hypothetical protein n=1 Tax=Ningiella sp. W23 TaxID=3023715 RepID=UPI003756D572